MSGDENAVFLWQHEHGSKWISYPAAKLEVINKAYNKGQKTVTLPDKDPKKQILINFEKMYQKNKVSSWEQRIRCCIFDDLFYVWQWKDEDGFYNSYTPGIALELETNYKLGKPTFKFYFKGDYEVNFTTFKQINEQSGTERDIQRIKSNASNVDSALLKFAVASKAHIKHKCEDDVKHADDVVRPKKAKVDLTPQQTVGDVKKLIINGKAPVDPECTELLEKAHVYYDGVDIYDAMLNQTNLQQNNNKFFRLQLLEDDNQSSYSVWFRWGRVGNKGQSKLHKFGKSNLAPALKTFKDKFYDKTRNDWDDRHDFEKVQGKYDLLKMDYGIDKVEEKEIKKEPNNIPESKLDTKIYSLMQMISDIKEIEKRIVEMKYDAKKAPLGKLTKEQIKAGYSALKKVEDILKNNEKGTKLIQACNDFYTRIPHNFGMKTPPLITTVDAIQEKMELLEALGDIEIAIKMLNDEKNSKEHPVDSHYRSIQCELKALNRNSPIFKLIENYLQNTHGPTHNLYTLEVIDIFECTKQGEEDKFVDYGNKYLLWHGSRLTNWLGILKHGLRIAPPEAPSTGFMFGKGIYFADVSSKSANYCYSTKTKNEGLLLLSEVSLGQPNELLRANYHANKLPVQKHSVKAVGKFRPDPLLEDQIFGVKVPLGKLIEAEDSAGFDLFYNEYIIYNTNQVKMKYLLHIKFNYIC